MKYGFIDINGKWISRKRFTYAEPFCRGAAIVDSKGKLGFIGTDGEWIAEPKYSRAFEFRDDLATVELDGLWGCIDRSGTMVINPFSTKPMFFENGYASAQIDSGQQPRRGLIDRSGNWVIPPHYGEVGNVSEGIVRVETYISGIGWRYGWLDLSERWVIEPVYVRASDFDKNGIARVSRGVTEGLMIRHEEYMAINRAGERVPIPEMAPDTITAAEEEEECRAEALAAGKPVPQMSDDGKWGYINHSGEWVILPKFLEAGYFSEEDIALVGI